MALFGKTKKDYDRDVEILKAWMKQQAHFPVFNDDEKLGNILIRNKCQVERTKTKLDKYFYLRGVYPNYFKSFVEDSEVFTNVRKGHTYFPLPVMTDKQERVTFYKVVDDDPKYFNCDGIAAMVLSIEELLTKNDNAVGEHVIKDWKGISMAHVKKMDLPLISKMMKLMQESYSLRILGFHYINCPSFMDIILQLFRPVFKEKIFSRIHIHKDLESLHRAIPKKYLPKDYGGDQPSTMELHKKWGKEYEAQKDYLLTVSSLVSNEKLRVGEIPVESDLYGAEGTFKKLNLD